MVVLAAPTPVVVPEPGPREKKQIAHSGCPMRLILYSELAAGVVAPRPPAGPAGPMRAAAQLAVAAPNQVAASGPVVYPMRPVVRLEVAGPNRRVAVPAGPTLLVAWLEAAGPNRAAVPTGSNRLKSLVDSRHFVLPGVANQLHYPA